MKRHLLANLWLLALTFVICCVAYPAALWVIGRMAFPSQAEGSLIREGDKILGSRLIAQPFTRDEYFWPRPSAASYNGAASAASNWGASNYLLRDRVARSLGPVVKYKSGVKKGQLVGPDVEKWFQADRYDGKPGIVAQWAQLHSTVAQNWVKADKLNEEFVHAWMRAHHDEVERWIKDNPDTPDPKPGDLAAPFFVNYSQTFPGTFPGTVEHKAPDGKTEKRIEPVTEGVDIQAVFFDMWRQEHPDVELESVPGDRVMASGSGLDPHITLENAYGQLDRVAGAWAVRTKRDKSEVYAKIKELLDEKAEAPLRGLAGVRMVNVLETNLAIRTKFEPRERASR